jgi:membrane peptidoglycan carboxypeptidase
MDIFSLASRVHGDVTLDQIMPQSEIWVGGALPSDVLDDLGTGIHRRFQALRTQDPYSLDLLCRVQDFRVTMALRYVVRLAKTLGVLSPLDPVLSLPLGSNSVTMEDVARMYYGFITGKVFPSEGETASEPSTFLISRIEGPDGGILYEAQPEPKRILSVEQSSLMSEILRKVVSHGTGRKAKKAILLSGPQNEDILNELEIRIPSLGKTGTSDEFRNSSYVGFIPGASKDGSSLTLDDGVVLAAYVGYDDNRSMKNKRIRIFGAAGALPIWIKAAQASVRYLDYEDRMDLVDLTFRPGRTLPIEWPKDMITIPVNSGSGIPQPKAKKGTVAHTYGSSLGEHLKLRRVFRPLQEGRI